MTPQEFIAKWGPGGPAYGLNERQGAQSHVVDLRQLLGVPTPGSDGDYIFEQDTLVLGEARGYADVFKRNPSPRTTRPQAAIWTPRSSNC